MKTKLEKGLRYLAAGIFFTALMLNVKFTLDSPYFLTGNELVAQTTGTGTGTDTGTTTETTTGTGNGTFDTPQNIMCPEDQWTTVYPASETWTITVSSGISFETAVGGAFKLISFKIEGSKITYTYTSESNSGVLTETYKTICNDVFYWLGCTQKSCRVL